MNTHALVGIGAFLLGVTFTVLIYERAIHQLNEQAKAQLHNLREKYKGRL